MDVFSASLSLSLFIFFSLICIVSMYTCTDYTIIATLKRQSGKTRDDYYCTSKTHLDSREISHVKLAKYLPLYYR